MSAQRTQYYNMLGIRDLRIIGRELGVKHPTALSKQALIDDIVAIEEGRLEPQFSVRGRPAKKTIVDLPPSRQMTEEKQKQLVELISDFYEKVQALLKSSD